jgi:putative Ca2+/H+ antiporter (TMEM165/GDT1 family)
MAIILFLGIGFKLIFDGIALNRKAQQEKSEIISNSIIKEALKDTEASTCSNNKEEIITEEKNELKANFLVFVQIFFLIFSAELGDKSQISTIYLSSNYHVSVVYIAVVLSQVILTIIAVFFGRLIMGKISESNLTLIAGCLFISFGLISLYLTYINDYMMIKNAFHKYLMNDNNSVEVIPDKILKNNFLKS